MCFACSGMVFARPAAAIGAESRLRPTSRQVVTTAVAVSCVAGIIFSCRLTPRHNGFDIRLDLERSGALRQRVLVNVPTLRVDGSQSNRTAHYVGWRGEPLLPPEILNRIVREADAEGIDAYAHARHVDQVTRRQSI